MAALRSVTPQGAPPLASVEALADALTAAELSLLAAAEAGAVLAAAGAAAEAVAVSVAALAAARKMAQPGDRIVVFGSFHTVAEALALV